MSLAFVKIHSLCTTSYDFILKNACILTNSLAIVDSTCAIATKFFPNFPLSVTKSTNVAYNFYGLCFIKFSINSIKKFSQQIYRNIHTKNKLIMVLASLRIMNTAISLFYTLNNALSAGLDALGYPSMRKHSFEKLRLLGVYAYALSLALYVTNLLINFTLLPSLKIIQENQLKSENLIEYIKIPIRLNSTESACEDLGEILLCQEIKDDTITKVVCIVEKNLAYDSYRIFLQGFGWIATGIMKAYPNTLKSMLAQWLISWAYLIDSIKKPANITLM